MGSSVLTVTWIGRCQGSLEGDKTSSRTIPFPAQHSPICSSSGASGRRRRRFVSRICICSTFRQPHFVPNLSLATTHYPEPSTLPRKIDISTKCSSEDSLLVLLRVW